MSSDMDPLEFEILGRFFAAPATTTATGKLSWRFPSAEQSATGVELPRWSDSLPTELQVNNETYEFGRVPRRDAKHSDKPAAFKSFKKAREVRAKASFGEHQIEIHCRITAKKEGKWYLWFHANPIRGAAPRPTSDNQADIQQLPDAELAGKLLSGGYRSTSPSSDQLKPEAQAPKMF